MTKDDPTPIERLGERIGAALAVIIVLGFVIIIAAIIIKVVGRILSL